MTALGLITILGYVAKLAVTGVQVAQAIQIARTALDDMVSNDRDPTEAELDAVRDRITARGRRIQDA